MASYHYTKNDLHDHAYSVLIDDNVLLQCMLNYLEIEMHETFLLDYGYLTAAAQQTYPALPSLVHGTLKCLCTPYPLEH